MVEPHLQEQLARTRSFNVYVDMEFGLGAEEGTSHDFYINLIPMPLPLNGVINPAHPNTLVPIADMVQYLVNRIEVRMEALEAAHSDAFFLTARRLNV